MLWTGKRRTQGKKDRKQWLEKLRLTRMAAFFIITKHQHGKSDRSRGIEHCFVFFFFYQLLRCTKLRHLATLLLALSGNEICEEREKKIGLNESSNEKPPPTAAEHQARASATRTRVRRKCPTFLSFFFVCGLRAWRRKRQRKLIKRFSLLQSTDFSSKGANEEKQMREKQKWKALAWLR